jgi:ABC-type multidrug transport system fused ATPase/permease subunit
MNLNVRYLEEFVTLTEKNNFLEAAECLFISQSCLSKHIKKLEAEIGVELFERTTRTVVLTEFGQMLLPYAKKMVGLEYEFEKRNQQLKEANLTAMKTMLLYTPLMTLALNITTVVVVWSGGNMIVAGNMQVGDLTAFTNYIVQIMSSLTMLSIAFLNWARAIASFRRVGEVLDEKIDLTDENAKHKDRAVCGGSVEFQNVSFRYYKNSPEWVIENISFKLEAGKTLGIIGSTGSGKSTLVSMIPRLYDTDEGTVLIDGINVRDYGLKPLREGIGMVLQNNTLFSGSITENLKWGDEHADEKAVRKAAQNAQAAGFIDSFKDGYRTHLEQSGNNVSGGQKQRLCIARALLKCRKYGVHLHGDFINRAGELPCIGHKNAQTSDIKTFKYTQDSAKHGC